MLLFVKRFCTVLFALLIAMSGYGLFIVPLIEPPAQQNRPLPEFASALGGDQWWQALFPPGSWQTNNPQIVQNDRGILLSRVWEQIGPKTLKLTPLTMILPQSSSEAGEHTGALAQQDVWIVSAEQGAIIHFENVLDLASGSIPTVERGQLNGSIQITRQVPEENDSAQAWSLRTSDLSIDRSRVFTQQEVVIQWQDGIIQGHDMKLTLQGDLLGSTGSPSSAWGPLRTLELFHVDRIDTALPNGGLWSKAMPPRVLGQPDLQSLPARLQVACGGRFTFDFTRSRAALVGGVQLVHQLGNLSPDEFSSQEVVIDVEPPNRQASASVGDSLRFGGIQVNEIEATGVDSLEDFVGERKVELKAPTIGAYASAKRLRVNLAENRIELDGKLHHAGATQSAAWLRYLDYEFTAPRIDYDANGAGTDKSVQHLGYLIAQGPGELRVPADSSVGSALVRWHTSLEMRPTETQGLQWVGLFGNVLVESVLHGYLASERLEIWLRKNQADPQNLAHPGPLSASPPSPRYFPERLRAEKQITLSTAQLKAQVDVLTLSINYINRSDTDRRSLTGPALSDSAGRPEHQWLQAPNASAAETPVAALPPAGGDYPNAFEQPSATQSTTGQLQAHAITPTVISGHGLTSSLIVADKQSWVDELVVSGPVHVRGQAIRPGTPGWDLVGDQLQMATNPAGQVDLQITGRPARIRLAEGSLEGPTIRFDQHNNLIWMDQPGEFTMPTSALAPRAGSLAATIHWFEPPHCTWQGQMLFDGKVIRIDGDIRFDGALRAEQNQFWWISGYSEVLQLELSQLLDLGDLSAGTAEPMRVTISDQVNILASHLDKNGNKQGRQQIQLPSLTFDIHSNEIIGFGPGSIRSWHWNQVGLGQLSGNSSAQPEGLQGAHLTFRDSMRGFLDRSELFFQGKVELAAGPLRSWDEAIDLAQMKRLSINQLLLDCDLLKIYDTSGLSSTASTGSRSEAKRSWEFQAKGNVNFWGKAESGDYEGSGAEVAYVQSKELLSLYGEPQRPATIKQTPADRSKGTIVASVVRGAINPRTLAIEQYEVGQNGLTVQLPDAANATAAPLPAFPAGPIPNPRGTVSEFFQRR